MFHFKGLGRDSTILDADSLSYVIRAVDVLEAHFNDIKIQRTKTYGIQSINSKLSVNNISFENNSISNSVHWRGNTG